ncbi:MAG: hypothetical protein Rubg2KO_21500 [Rubricoccaceae bacterium]
MMRACSLAAVLLACPLAASAQTFTVAENSVFEERLAGLIGMAVVDVDRDGRADLLDANGMHRQTENGFDFIRMGAQQGGGMLAADINGDGFREVVKLNFVTPVPYRYSVALGDAVAISGTGIDDFASSTLIQGSLFLDDDLDGEVDLFIGDDGPPDVLFRNTGGQFTDAGPIFPQVRTGTYGAAAADYNNSGRLGIYIGLCREDDGGTQNVLYHRNADSYSSNAIFLGLDDPNPSWGVAWLDYDNDGKLDVYVANMPSTSPVERPGLNTLNRNIDLSSFEDVAATAGVAGPTTDNSWSVVAADFDNDGWTDLFVANRPEPSRLWRNKGDGTFEDVTASAGIANEPTIAVTAGDINGDGWVDLVTGSKVFFNDGGSNHWLRVQLRGTSSTPDGIGARVEVTAGGQTQIREITGGDGMMSQSHGLEAHVGLGTETTADVTVRWPSGQVTELTGIAADQLLTIVEGEGVNAPPAAFDLSSPVDGDGVAVAAPVELAWETAADSDPITYTVLLHRPDGSELSYVTSSTTFEVPASDVGTEGAYGWAVVANDGWTPRTSLSRREFVVGGPIAKEPDADQPNLQLIVSPNPTRGQVEVRVEGANTLGVLDVLDVRGRVVTTVDRVSERASLDLRGFPSGLYVVRFLPEEGAAVQAMLVHTP